MEQYRIELAGPADDGLLRQVLASTPMPGAIAIGYQREPSYFAAGVVEGSRRQVVVARHVRSGALAMFGTRSIMPRYVNGEAMAVGYLSNLRAVPEHRGRGLLARGYRFFRELHGDGQTRVYLTTIAEDNLAARGLLSSGRAGLPRYGAVGRFHTGILSVWRSGGRTEGRPLEGVVIRPAGQEDKAAILDFLQAVGRTRQFFPCYQDADVFVPNGLLHGLRPEDVLLAWRDGKLVGTLGAWDQTAFRQNVVHGYAGALRWLRPCYNFWARFSGQPRLPRVGEVLQSRLAALPLVAAGQEEAFRRLLDAQLQRLRGTNADYLMVGLHEVDPLLPIVRQYRARWYTTVVYLVCWSDGEAIRAALDQRPPYLELGAL